MNVSLIGMPSSGKSSVGVILAKILAFGFVDTDILIQSRYSRPLQDIVDKEGYLVLREIERREILSLKCDNTVISTGGSVIYSEDAIEYLRAISVVIYLRISYDEMVRRLGDYTERGLAKPKSQTLREMFVERERLYGKCAHIVFDNVNISVSDAAIRIAGVLNDFI